MRENCSNHLVSVGTGWAKVDSLQQSWKKVFSRCVFPLPAGKNLFQSQFNEKKYIKARLEALIKGSQVNIYFAASCKQCFTGPRRGSLNTYFGMMGVFFFFSLKDFLGSATIIGPNFPCPCCSYTS